LIALVLGLASFGTSAQVSVGTPKEDIDILIDEGIPIVEKMLREHGRFFPFSLAMTTAGEVRLVATDDAREQPSPQDLIDPLLALLRKAAQEGRYRAVAVFAAVRMTDPRRNAKIDVVQAGFEHVSGLCGNMFFPYALPLEEIDRNQILLTPRNETVFEACGF